MEYIKQFFEVIFYLLITMGIFALAYFSTKLIAKRSFDMQKNKNLKVVEKVSLGKEKEAAIIKVGNEYFLAGISSGSVNFSGPLNNEIKESLVLQVESNADLIENSFMPFKSYKAQELTVKLSIQIKKFFNILKGGQNKPNE